MKFVRRVDHDLEDSRLDRLRALTHWASHEEADPGDGLRSVDRVLPDEGKRRGSIPRPDRILDAERHLVCYKLAQKAFKSSNRDVWRRRVETADQFGKLRMRTAHPRELCLPATKELLD